MGPTTLPTFHSLSSYFILLLFCFTGHFRKCCLFINIGRSHFSRIVGLSNDFFLPLFNTMSQEKKEGGETLNEDKYGKERAIKCFFDVIMNFLNLCEKSLNDL